MRAELLAAAERRSLARPGARLRRRPPIETQASHPSWQTVEAAAPLLKTPPSARRIIAVVIDLMILAVIDATVISFHHADLRYRVQRNRHPAEGPLIAFLLVQNGGYLVAFTAGGQTLGKMAAGIRVVPADADELSSISAARFSARSLWLVLAVPVGPRLPHRDLQPRSSRPPRPLRRHARRP